MDMSVITEIYNALHMNITGNNLILSLQLSFHNVPPLTYM